MKNEFVEIALLLLGVGVACIALAVYLGNGGHWPW